MRKLPFDLYSSLNQKIIDGLIAGVSFCLAYQALFEGHVPPGSALQMWTLAPAVMLGQVTVNTALRTYRMIWKYVGLRDAIVLARNYALFPVFLIALRHGTPPALSILHVPLSIIVAEYLLSLAAALAVRAARRLLYEGAALRVLKGKNATPVLFIGAGRTGVQTAHEIRARLDLRPMAFLDDDPQKAGSVVAGLRVLGPLSLLSAMIEKYAIRQVMVCIARPPREVLRRIWATCELLGISVKVVPTLDDVLHGRINIANFRNVEMNDLLGRSPIEASVAEPELRLVYSGKCILVTGAGGSIGSELAVQLSKLGPKHLLLLDKDENGLNDTYLQLESHRRGNATPVVADIRFADRLRGIFETFRPEVVFHAAAHKHVHLMETNPCEAITNNVTGTLNLIEQSVATGVARFIQISTDKAVNPTSIMGASKRVCEMIVQAHGNHPGTRFCCVRFGNVLGSRGSVVPIFQEQILRGGPLTVTHPEAQRFLMTIPEAVCLLLQAGTLAEGREIFVLDMGEAVLIQKLAQDLVELSGLSPNHDVRIEITGLKQGEKLSEALVDHSRETLRRTRLHKIQTISAEPFDTGAFAQKLRALERAAWDGDEEEVYGTLADLKIGYVSRERAKPLAYRASASCSPVALQPTQVFPRESGGLNRGMAPVPHAQ